MVEALDVDAIQKVWNDYFVLIGVEQVKRRDETRAVSDASSSTRVAADLLAKETATAQRAFDSAKQEAEEKHIKQVDEINATLQGVRDIATAASQATKDHQDKAEKELGVRPNIPQAAAASNVRRTQL